MNYQHAARIGYTQFAYMFFKSMFNQEEYEHAPRYFKDILSVTLSEWATQENCIDQPEFYEEFYTELTEGCYFVEFFLEQDSMSLRRNQAIDMLLAFLEQLYPGCSDRYGVPIEFGEANDMRPAYNALAEFFTPMFIEVVGELYTDEMNQRQAEQVSAQEELSNNSSPTDPLLVLSRIQDSLIFTTPNDLNFPLHYLTQTPHNIYKQESRVVDGQLVFFQLIRIPSVAIDQSFFTTVVVKDPQTNTFRVVHLSEILKIQSISQAEQVFHRTVDSFDDLLTHCCNKNEFFKEEVLIKRVPDSPDFPTLL